MINNPSSGRNSDIFRLALTAGACSTISNAQYSSQLLSFTLVRGGGESRGDAGLSVTKKGLSVTLGIVSLVRVGRVPISDTEPRRWALVIRWWVGTWCGESGQAVKGRHASWGAGAASFI